MEILEGHDFPGNLRELDNVIASAVVLETGDTLGVGSLPASLRAAAPPRGNALRGVRRTLADMEAEHIRAVMELHQREPQRRGAHPGHLAHGAPLQAEAARAGARLVRARSIPDRVPPTGVNGSCREEAASLRRVARSVQILRSRRCPGANSDPQQNRRPGRSPEVACPMHFQGSDADRGVLGGSNGNHDHCKPWSWKGPSRWTSHPAGPSQP